MVNSFLLMLAKAKSPLTHPDELSTLANSEFTQIRFRVARNPNTPCDILGGLAEDDTWIVRLAVACNENTPIDVVVKLCDDEDESVCEMARENFAERSKK